MQYDYDSKMCTCYIVHRGCNLCILITLISYPEYELLYIHINENQIANPFINATCKYTVIDNGIVLFDGPFNYSCLVNMGCYFEKCYVCKQTQGIFK